MDVAVSAGHRVKLKEGDKREKYLDLAKKLKKLWNVTVTSIVIGVFGTVPKGLVKGLKELEMRTALLRSTRILRRVPKT